MSRKVHSIVIKHAYDDYDFYHCVFVPSRVPKLLEAEGACYAIEQLIRKNPRIQEKELKIVEFMSGRGEFEEYIRAEARFPIDRYIGIDAVAHDEPRTELMIGDVTTDFPDFSADIIMALYYSASSVHGPEGKPTPETMRAMCTNAYHNLDQGGGLFLGFAAQGEALSFDISDEDEDEERQVPIPVYNGLRPRFGLDTTEDAHLSFSQENVYDRNDGLVVETMKNVRVIRGEDKVIGRITVNEPLHQLYMSESHIVDNLRQAGFEEFMFFDISFDEGHVTIEQLDSPMTESEQFATHIMAIRK